MEATPRLELGVEILQTSALPLGYVAECPFGKRQIPLPLTLGPPQKRLAAFVRRGERNLWIGASATGGRGMEQVSSDVGAGNEARTRYLHLGKVALYQMSYARI